MSQNDNVSDVERIKSASRHLRGTLVESLADAATGAVADDDTQITKFHGIYQQDDRDQRNERRRKKLEPHYQFMVRLRLPGGVLTGSQWIAVDEIGRRFGDGSLRLTTRQTFQFHGVLKHDIKPLIQAVDRVALDSKGACGDVNRNVICNTNPYESAAHGEVYAWASRLSDHLCWQSGAYGEVWLDHEKVHGAGEEEPLYGDVYLPRKFKIAIAIPPLNDVDVFANDLGLIAVLEGSRLAGFNVAVGGGMGMTYGEPNTYPRLGDVIGFCTPEQTLRVAQAIISIQRDHGDRANRKHARFKYTIDDRGLDWFRGELEARLGEGLDAPRPYAFESNGDRFGWVEGDNGHWHVTLHIPNGRVIDRGEKRLMSGLRRLAETHTGQIRLTCNQNVIIADIAPGERANIEAIIAEYGLEDGTRLTGIRRNAMACVAFPTCGLAMAESERYLPDLLTRLEAIMAEAGLENDPVNVRMTGCPNGCARPYLAEIGFTGKAPGKYNLYLGAGFAGDRLNKLYRENIGEDEILATLSPIIHRYAQERESGERFGDFVVRAGYVAAVTAGRHFHD